MGTNEAKLYQKIMSDRTIQAELIQAGNETERIGIIVRQGESHGLSVTPEAVHGFLMRGHNEELSDGELETVVGGKGNPNEEIKGDKWAWIGLPDDDLSGGDGNDTIRGGTGDDTLHGDSGDDMLTGNDGDDLLIGGTGNDDMHGDDDFGSTGNDTLDGGAGNDSMQGGYGDDSLIGGSGNDVLKGQDGNDTLDGGEGRDWIVGGEGDDTLTGGSGSDVFVFRMDDGNDTITDFTVNEDILRFSGADFEDIDVRIENGNTIVTYGQTVITLEGVEMNKDQVWAHADN